MTEPRAGADPGPDEPHTGWPDEPDEFDPQSTGPDVPTLPESGEASNPEAVRLFVKLVVVFNVALLALAVGPMFVVFRNQREFGTQIFLVGLLAFGYGTFRYYQFKSGSDDDEQNG